MRLCAGTAQRSSRRSISLHSETKDEDKHEKPNDKLNGYSFQRSPAFRRKLAEYLQRGYTNGGFPFRLSAPILHNIDAALKHHEHYSASHTQQQNGTANSNNQQKQQQRVTRRISGFWAHSSKQQQKTHSADLELLENSSRMANLLEEIVLSGSPSLNLEVIEYDEARNAEFANMGPLEQYYEVTGRLKILYERREEYELTHATPVISEEGLQQESLLSSSEQSDRQLQAFDDAEISLRVQRDKLRDECDQRGLEIKKYRDDTEIHLARDEWEGLQQDLGVNIPPDLSSMTREELESYLEIDIGQHTEIEHITLGAVTGATNPADQAARDDHIVNWFQQT